MIFVFGIIDAFTQLNSDLENYIDLSGRLIVLTNTFSSQNASETFSYGNTFSNVPIIVGARAGNINLQTDEYISAMVSYIDGIRIDRTNASAYGGSEFHVLLFIPNN